MVTGGLEAEPTVTTTDCASRGASGGTTKLIWVWPTRPAGTPTTCVAAGIPPTVTVTGRRGLGRRARFVPGAGGLPLTRAGVTSPSPVMKSVTVLPRWAVALGSVRLPLLAKTPGAAAAT